MASKRFTHIHSEQTYVFILEIRLTNFRDFYSLISEMDGKRYNNMLYHYSCENVHKYVKMIL